VEQLNANIGPSAVGTQLAQHTMPADLEPKSRKRRERKKSGPSFFFPSSIVCTAQDALHTTGGVEVGILLILAVLGFYVYGFMESMQALPHIPTGRLLGQNLNIARLEPDRVDLPEGLVGGRALEEPQTLTVDAVQIPAVGKWPVTTRDEEDRFETLIHPGDRQTELRVPKFWSPPLHNKKLFTREQAMKIGTCLTPDPVTGSHVRGTDCPLNERTIFVAIASYRDYQCRYTVESIFTRAKNPHRIRIGTSQSAIAPHSKSQAYKLIMLPC
jgi:hypothetical protein